MALVSLVTGSWSSLSSVISTASGWVERRYFIRSATPGSSWSWTLAASFPLCATAAKLDEAPGSSAAIPTGVIVGSAAMAGLMLASLASSR